MKLQQNSIRLKLTGKQRIFLTFVGSIRYRRRPYYDGIRSMTAERKPHWKTGRTDLILLILMFIPKKR